MKYFYCYNCGNRIEYRDIDSISRGYCENCDIIFYENPIPSVAIIAENQRREILLVKRNVRPGIGKWCLPGGFIEKGEKVEESVHRELQEETGLLCKFPKLFSVNSINNGYYGDIILITYSVTLENFNICAGDDACDAGFFSLDLKPEIAFDLHNDLINKWYVQNSK